VITGVGLAVSVAGNVGHLAVADWASRATAAVPPLAAAAALAVGLAVLKRVTDQPRRGVTPRVTAWRPDAIRKIAADEGCAPKTAQLVQRRERAAVKAASNGHGGPHA
jgi:sugar phosphate permease